MFSAHQILASVATTPELALDKTEAHELATAISNVSRHYDVEASEKVLDWTRLGVALGMVYGPRLFAIRARTRRERAANPAPVSVAPVSPSNPRGNANVIEIPGVGKVDTGGFN